MAAVKNGLAPPSPDDLMVGTPRRSIGEHFESSSKTAPDEPASISLELRDGFRSGFALLDDDEVVTSSVLHRALRALTLNSARPGTTGRIGIVLADRHETELSSTRPPLVYGEMFDGAFDPSEGADVSKRRPREGCAIYLTTIREQRAREGHANAAILGEIAYTVLHELGHVFNLPHRDRAGDPFTFMTSAKRYGANLGLRRFVFDGGEGAHLARCGHDDRVTPGGSAYAAGPSGSVGALRAQSQLPELSITMSQAQFYPFEPVELDITLSMPARGRAKTASIPCKLDPGYEDFVIWIERPDGERRRYKPRRVYCGGRGQMTLSRGADFTRDISVFAQSGGYTFAMPGAHRIWVTFDLGRRGVLESNAVEITVKPATKIRREFRAFLTDPQVARVLYHRNGHVTHDLVQKFVDFRREHPKEPAAAAAGYAIGRALARQGAARSRRGAEGSFRPETWLAWALDHRELGGHRRTKASEVLDRLS